jgi:diphthamide biosynthesis protein 2
VRGKKCYEVLVGKLNEPKLKNIAVVDLYVFVGCKETSLIDAKDFLMPVVTPHEALMALRADLFPWESKIITDFNELLPVSHLCRLRLKFVETCCSRDRQRS